MPIYDLQDNQKGSLPRLGIIRLGTKAPNSKGNGDHPVESPFFILADAPAVRAAYGDQPGELLIYLPFPTLDENMVTWHELWRGGICGCRGDSKRIKSLYSDDLTQRLVRDYEPEMACPGMKHDLYKRCAGCKPHLTLMLMVRSPADPTQLVDGFGYYQLRSASSINIGNLTGQLRYVEDIQRKRGLTLQGIPMKLRRVQREFTYTDKSDGNVKTTRKWLLDLEYDLEWSRLAGQAMRALGMGEMRSGSADHIATVEGEYEEPPAPATAQVDENGDQDQADPAQIPEWPARPWTLATVRRYFDFMYANMSDGAKSTPMTGEEHQKLGRSVKGIFPDDEARHIIQFMLLGETSIGNFNVAQGKTMRAWARDAQSARREVDDIIASPEFADASVALVEARQEATQ